jgi:hypothetical protein
VIAVGQVKRLVLLATLAIVLMATAGESSASAAQPWWHMSVSSRPVDLKSGVAKDEVQQIKVAATKGEVTVIEPVSYKEALNGGGFAVLKYTFFKYNATHEEAQAALEGIYGTGNVRVEGGPGDETGTKPYVVTFTGGLADQSLGLMVTELNIGGLNGEASVSEQAKGRADGTIVLVASDLGTGPVDGSKEPVTVTDRLPAGLKAVGMSGVASTYSSGVDNHGPVVCTVSSLACTFEGVLPAYEQIEVSIPVLVQPGASSGEVDEASVDGGGAQIVSGRQSLTFGGEPVFGIENYEQSLEQQGGAIDTQAGSHPFQFTTTFNLNQTAAGEPVALPKDVRFDLPPGLVGNPTPLPQCTIGQFLSLNSNGNECASDTAIGVTRTTINLNGQVVTAVSPIFNLEPQAGEPARFAFYVAVAPIIMDTSVRTGSDYGVTVTVRNISQVPGFIASQTTFWGVPGDPVHDNVRGWGCLAAEVGVGFGGGTCSPQEELNPPPFLSLPTSCAGPLTDSMEADPWDRPGSFVSLSDPMQTLDGCNRLSFEPSISVAPEGEQASSPTGLTVGIHVPQDELLNPTGLAEANVKDTTVTLPAGVAINPAAADGLMSCSSSQIALEVDAPPSCPEASKVGTVEIKSPLLPNALTGAVYLAAQDANPFGSLVALYIVAEDPVSGTLIKVAGEVKLDPVTGQLVSTFDNTPQLPFEELKLSFFGGARAPLATPAVCGSYTTGAAIAPWSGSPASTPSSRFQITNGPNGSPCASPLPFAPSLTAGTTNIQAGGFSPFTMTVSREDGQQNIGVIQLHMPPGLSGLLTGVELCSEAHADAGSCGANSLIGETTVSVGLGGDPYSVSGGRVYITGPYEGAPFGLSIVVPAKAGPYDLGTVVVRGTIQVDPITSALTVTTNSPGQGYAIPHILDGIPLQIKHVNFITTRPGFTFNPTNCDPLAITGSLSSVEGSTRALSVPFQATNCATLAFKPGFSVSTSGQTSRAAGASLSVKLTYPKAPFGSQANIKSVKVDLPKQLPSRLTTLQKACPAKTFEANPANCSVASIVGHGKALTPLIPVPLEGPAYFVSYGGAKFPELVVVLQGYGVTLDLHGETFISKTGITSSTFHTVPDAPVGSFELTLPEGKNSALAANGNLCKAKLKMPTAFTAQNGTVIHQSTPIGVTGCAKHKTKKAKKAGKRHQGKTTPGKKK